MAEVAVAIPSKPNGLLPIAANKTYNTRSGNVAEKLRYDVTGYALNQVRELLVAVCAQEMEQQISLDNPPAFADVDGVRGKGIANAERKVVISFGVRLKAQALNDLKAALKSAIEHSTVRKSGRLADMANWQYRWIRNGKVTALPIMGASGIPMGPSDFIILMPVGVINDKGQAYATAVNKRVASGGKLTFRRSAKSRPRARDQGLGFLALVARACASRPAFDGFNVLAGFTSRHAVGGEVVHRTSKNANGAYRTGFLKISPKTGRRG